MQAPTVAETPKIQAPEPARPDQSKNEGRGFARLLERSLAPARRERPAATADHVPDKPAADPTTDSADISTPPASKPTDTPPEIAEIAVVAPAVTQPDLATGIEPDLPSTNQAPVAPCPEITASGATPAIVAPTTGGPVLPLVTALVPTATDTKALPTATVPDAALPPAIILPTTVTNDHTLVTADDAKPAATTATIASAPATTAVPAAAVSEAAQAVPTASVTPVVPVKPRTPATTAALPSKSDDASAPAIHDDDAAFLLNSIPPTDQSSLSPAAVSVSSSVVGPAITPLASSADDATAPTAAMPHAATTPTTAPATPAGAALGNQSKTQLNTKAKPEAEPLDLQAKATTTSPTITPAATSTTNAPAAVAGTRDATPAAPLTQQEPNPMERAVAQQIGRAIVQHLPNGERMMVLRLTPPELGTVRIEVIERQGVMSARLHAEDDGVRLALERTLPQMRQELRASDAPIRELTLTDQSQFQRPDGQDQTQRQQDQQAERRQRTGEGFSLDLVRDEPLVAPRSRDLGIRVDANGVDALA